MLTGASLAIRSTRSERRYSFKRVHRVTTATTRVADHSDGATIQAPASIQSIKLRFGSRPSMQRARRRASIGELRSPRLESSLLRQPPRLRPAPRPPLRPPPPLVARLLPQQAA